MIKSTNVLSKVVGLEGDIRSLLVRYSDNIDRVII